MTYMDHDEFEAGERIPAAREKSSAIRSLAVPLLAIGVACGVVDGLVTYWLGTPKGQTVMRTSAGHSVSVLFRYAVTDVEIQNEDGTQTFTPLNVGYVPIQSAGTLGVLDGSDRATTPTRVATVILPPSQVRGDGPTKLKFKYRAFGIRREATIAFDGQKEDCRFARNVLASMPTSWVAFRTDAHGQGTGDSFVYFSTMLAYKYAIREIRYGFDDDPLTQRVRFTESNVVNIDKADQIYISAPRSASHIRVQIVYKDDVESPVQTILRSDATIP